MLYFQHNFCCVFWGSRNLVLRIFGDFWSPRGRHSHYFLTKVTDLFENCGTSILWDPACFHRIFRDMTLPESIRNKKTAPYEISCILTMPKRVPGLIFWDVRSSLGTISDHISQLFQASFSSTQNRNKLKSHLLSRRGYPGHITEEGGNIQGPRKPQEASLS